jgi:L-threonylcarbamoyladenylate synthase
MGACRDGRGGDRERLTGAADSVTRGAGGSSLETLAVDGEAPDPAALERAARVLLAGGLLIYPTDTQYALGGRAVDPAVGRRVRAAKGRAERKPLPLVAADAAQAAGLVVWSAGAQRLAERFWPGPLTLVLPAVDGLPEDVTQGTGTLAVRVPALRLARELCSRAGPLISTSANRAGAPGPVECAEALAQVGAAADLALDAGPGRTSPSTIVDLTCSPPRLLREGAVAWGAVEGAWWGRTVP